MLPCYRVGVLPCWCVSVLVCLDVGSGRSLRFARCGGHAHTALATRCWLLPRGPRCFAEAAQPCTARGKNSSIRGCRDGACNGGCKPGAAPVDTPLAQLLLGKSIRTRVRVTWMRVAQAETERDSAKTAATHNKKTKAISWRIGQRSSKNTRRING